MKLITLILLFYVLSHATEQYKDKLIFNKRTYSIPYIKSNYKTDERYSTACWRGYVATWKVNNDSLFLKKVTTKECSRKNKSKEVGAILGKNRFTSWYSGNIIIPYYKKIGSIGKTKIYEQLVLNFENGKCVNKFPTYFYFDRNIYLRGVFYFDNGEYPKALANFSYIASGFTDFINISQNYIYLATCLRYLGYIDLSNSYLDSVITKYPESQAYEYAIVIKYISGKEFNDSKKKEVLLKIKNKNLRSIIQNSKRINELFTSTSLNEFGSELKILFPWFYLPVSKYRYSLKPFFEGTINEKPRPDIHYELEFNDDKINGFYYDLKNNDRARRKGQTGTDKHRL